ncbi:DNA endonuclease SmrA [Rheinheimera riviphila]|uniref:DNA endonuclease SmrA n=1 Tax=Rheinheimera riviphila TaxID=1834037 RepID=A0A437R4W7_9GAMM|nr:DNA endonuclease SmrA [Rheinheimera riviphila]RVU41782.1 DNA endonuclease SmrA [Rheinheimera riviphila]
MAEDDFTLFLQEMADVKRLKTDVLTDENGEHQPTLAQLARRKAAELEPEYDANYLRLEYVDLVAPDEVLAYKKDGVQEGVYKNLRLGKYQIDATLMLLGKNLTDARRALFEFVADCHQRGIRTLLVHHGMGRDSKPQPAILKSYTYQWLKQIPAVLACHTAQKTHGSYAATYVLLQKNTEQKRENRDRHQKS